MKTIKELELSLIVKEAMIQQLKFRINKTIEYIKEYCIDDEFYINLTNKEKNIIDVLDILDGKENEN